MDTDSSAADSYTLQKAFEDRQLAKIPNVIGKPGIIDSLRHNRVYDLLQPMYQHFASNSWLTIGDSGADSYSLVNRGVTSVTASCLSANRLQNLQDMGHLEGIEIKEINAEDTLQEDNSFDVVMCKEAYHHFPRSLVAFYELLRTAKSAVVYLEPCAQTGFYPLDTVRSLVKKILRKQDFNKQNFEPAGNYIFSMSPSEVEQMATAIQLPCIAIRKYNNFYMHDLCVKPNSNKTAVSIFNLALGVQNILASLRLMSWGLVCVIVFKEKPDESLISELKSKGFEIRAIPKNPYLAEQQPAM